MIIAAHYIDRKALQSLQRTLESAEIDKALNFAAQISDRKGSRSPPRHLEYAEID